MTLTLQIENFHVLDDGGPVSILVPETGIQVGRRSGMNWVLPDASRYISGHHFDVALEDGKWWLHDRSTNGTFLQGHRHRLDGPHALHHGDRFQVGQYVIVALFDLPQGHAMTPGSLPEHRMDSPVDEPMTDDPWSVGAVHAPIEVYPVEIARRGPDFARDFVPFPTVPPTAPAPAAAPAPQPAPAPVPTPVPAAASQADPSAVLRAFCEGAGLSIEYAKDVPAEDLARNLGQALRATTTHIMAALQDRAAARHFTRAGERTMRGATDNNPLKFLPDAEQAMDALFLRPRAGFLTGADGFDAALWDLRRHQSALFAALQPALLALVEDLDPGRIDTEVKGAALMGNRKSRTWDEFVTRWDAKTASENGMLDEFIRLFAQAYRKAHDREGLPD
ncbi:type VI secretion system-associated FHA domain protein TagH [Paracoccus lutimaris]|uniref:FHA domain protein n=1 Tax=Paracoccus lutimaris TaxID=1490030 RepID=A0A368Z6A9_9RHOB|nr:type VI secretion system-associated FHA domain protein TagH [Paracoccus lutimaris]RCW87036.1 FHA domain protein [Paracoccus lutimaris]